MMVVTNRPINTKSNKRKLQIERINVVEENDVKGRKYQIIAIANKQSTSIIRNAGSSRFHLPFACRCVVIIRLTAEG